MLFIFHAKLKRGVQTFQNFVIKMDESQWRIQRLIWAHREHEARAWENQLGVCKPPSGYRAEPCWWTGGEAPGKF